MVDVVAVGEVRPRRVLTRSGGRPGDELWVSGTIGGAAAGLEMLQAGVTPGPAMVRGNARQHERVPRLRRPQPRVRLGKAMAQARAARAAIDLSDGLADAADQLAAASGCGVEIDSAALPIEPAAREWWKAAGKDDVLRAMGGGDDYELLFAIPRAWGGRLRHARERVAEPADEDREADEGSRLARASARGPQRTSQDSNTFDDAAEAPTGGRSLRPSAPRWDSCSCTKPRFQIPSRPQKASGRGLPGRSLACGCGSRRLPTAKAKQPRPVWACEPASPPRTRRCSRWVPSSASTHAIRSSMAFGPSWTRAPRSKAARSICICGVVTKRSASAGNPFSSKCSASAGTPKTVSTLAL